MTVRPTQHPAPPSRSFWLSSETRNAIKDFSRVYLIQMVIATLVASWLLIAWIVLSVEKDAPSANITTYGKALWWGIVTFLTVGYGDFYPITALGRLFAGILMCEGVLSVAIVTSKISSYFLEQILREGIGSVKTSELNRHFIICGWKEEMQEILCHILDFNPALEPKDLILIANCPTEYWDSVRLLERLKGVKIISGNYYEATQLKLAAPERAQKILILADKSPLPSGLVPNQSEIDSRTIMTAMTLASIARGTQVIAEILDPKMDQYLKMAGVSEVIYSREYSRLLLGNAAGGTGIANVIFDLLDPGQPTSIATRPIPEADHGTHYPAFKARYEQSRPECVVIGILENTGNIHSIKEQALRDAQKTTDVTKLVQNLKQVKQIRCNQPLFHPDSDYIIPPGAMAIVVETKNA